MYRTSADALASALGQLDLCPTNTPEIAPLKSFTVDPTQLFAALAPSSLISRSDENAKLFAEVHGTTRREMELTHVGPELRNDLSNEFYDDPKCAAIRFEAFNAVQHIDEILGNCDPVISDQKPFSVETKGNVTIAKFSQYRNVSERVLNFVPVVIVCSDALYTHKKNLAGQMYQGEVKNCSGDLVLEICTAKPKFFDPDIKYYVYIKPFETTYQAIADVGKALINGKNIITKIYGNRTFRLSKEAFIKNRITDMEQDQPCRIEPFLNKAQREAIYSIQMQSPDNTFVLFGPPGTGKTTTLTEAIKSIMKHPQDKKSPKFLVCTPSNMAADNFGIALMKSNAVPKSKILRILASRFEFSMIDDALKDIVYTCNNMLALPDRDDFMKYDVVISTIGCSTKLRRFGTKHFTHILIDEAGQTTEPETLIPFFLLSNPNTRFIMAGDPKQLGPVIVNNVLNKPMFRFDESLLMRLAEKKEYQEDPRLMIQLTDNHRSHEVIVTAASEIIYNGTLVHTCPDGHDFFSGHKILNYNPWPIRFHAVFGQEQGMDSKYNKEEANVVADYVKKLLDHTPELSQFDIGIISPYKEQGRQLTNALSRYRDITIDTVEKFQGSERRVIIMSTTRTKGLGFVDEIRRFNTAITRAQQLLIVVGHPNALVKSNFWRIFMHYCASNDCFYANDEDDVLKWKAYFMNETVPEIAYEQEEYNEYATNETYHNADVYQTFDAQYDYGYESVRNSSNSDVISADFNTINNSNSSQNIYGSSSGFDGYDEVQRRETDYDKMMADFSKEHDARLLPGYTKPVAEYEPDDAFDYYDNRPKNKMQSVNTRNNAINALRSLRDHVAYPSFDSVDDDKMSVDNQDDSDTADDESQRYKMDRWRGFVFGPSGVSDPTLPSARDSRDATIYHNDRAADRGSDRFDSQRDFDNYHVHEPYEPYANNDNRPSSSISQSDRFFQRQHDSTEFPPERNENPYQRDLYSETEDQSSVYPPVDYYRNHHSSRNRLGKQNESRHVSTTTTDHNSFRLRGGFIPDVRSSKPLQYSSNVVNVQRPPENFVPPATNVDLRLLAVDAEMMDVDFGEDNDFGDENNFLTSVSALKA